MSKICYIPRRFNGDSKYLVRICDTICQEYEAMGYNLTLRQLYYQCVSRDILPNSDKSYDRLGTLINDARLAGEIDWNHLEDRTRNLQSLMHFNGPTDRIVSAANSYNLNLWEDQDYHIEIWVEKEALADVVSRVANRNDVSYFSCRGYVSASEMHVAGRRLANVAFEENKEIIILHLGDHDPSGMDMSRDIEERLRLFMTQGHDQYIEQYEDGDFDGKPAKSPMPDWYIDEQSERLMVKRIALNMAQIRQYNPPPNPAKLADTRAQKYIEAYGNQSWELDALSPQVLDALIQTHISEYRDADKFNAKLAETKKDREEMQLVASNWKDVTAHLQSKRERRQDM